MDIRRLILEVIAENVTFGKGPLDQAIKRLGADPSHLQTYALHRAQFPKKDIGQVTSKEELEQMLTQWMDGAAKRLSKVKPFTGNEQLAKKYLSAYVNNVSSLEANARPISFSDPEKTLVDVCNNNRWVEDNVVMASTASMDKPHSEDVVFESEEVVIIKAPKKSRCILYGQGESWCIGKADMNMYVTYRIQYGASIYFVLQKNKPESDNERKLVILNYGPKGYAIADRSNAGNRHGGPELAGPWSKVESEIPVLHGLERYFPHKAVDESEKRYEEIVSHQLKTKDVNQEVSERVRGLTIDGEPVSVMEFLRDHIASGNGLTDEQFASLEQSQMAELVEYGIWLSDGQFVLLDDKTKRRYVNVCITNELDLSDMQFATCTPEQQLRYGVQRGLRLSDLQYANASPELKVEYLKLASSKVWKLSDSQYADLSPEMKHEYIRSYKLTDAQYAASSPELKADYITYNTLLSDAQYAASSPELKAEYIRINVYGYDGLTDAQYAASPTELKVNYLKLRGKTWFEELTDIQKKDYQDLQDTSLNEQFFRSLIRGALAERA